MIWKNLRKKKKTAPCLNFLLILAKISHGYNYSCNQIIEIWHRNLGLQILWLSPLAWWRVSLGSDLLKETLLSTGRAGTGSPSVSPAHHTCPLQHSPPWRHRWHPCKPSHFWVLQDKWVLLASFIFERIDAVPKVCSCDWLDLEELCSAQQV